MDWTCPDCPRFTILGVDAPGHEESSQAMIAHHQAQHAVQLDEHDGDQDALRARLQTAPAVAAALNITTEREQP